MPIARCTLTFLDGSSGLGWSITSFRNDVNNAATQTAADAFLAKYMAVCEDSVSLVELRISDPSHPGSFEVFLPASFIHGVGTLSAGIVPVAEAALVKGDTQGPIDLAHTHWYLHGLDKTVLATSGELDQANAAVIALRTAAAAWFLNYRKTATPAPPAGKGWPVVSPPTGFADVNLAGPYVRRLGTTFFRPGQHRRYKT